MVTDAGRPVGIVTERDLVQRIMAENLNPKEVKVSEFMSKHLISARPKDDLKKA
ncbi:MAG: CBS domain-containing protein, partial [Nitrososphaerales archaeon]